MGTLALTFIMYVAAPRIIGRRMDLVQMLATLLNRSWQSALVVHIVTGSLVLPIFYSYVVSPYIPLRPWLRGALWGLFLWLLVESVAVPLAGGGVFHVQAGALPAALTSLGAHLLYGLTLGLVAAPLAPLDRSSELRTPFGRQKQASHEPIHHG